MSSGRCPYHVRQGVVDTKGKLQITDICGVKSANCQLCPLAPFTVESFKVCARYVSASVGAERQLLIPKSDIEYTSDLDGSQNFSDTKLL